MSQKRRLSRILIRQSPFCGSRAISRMRLPLAVTREIVADQVGHVQGRSAGPFAHRDDSLPMGCREGGQAHRHVAGAGFGPALVIKTSATERNSGFLPAKRSWTLHGSTNYPSILTDVICLSLWRSTNYPSFLTDAICLPRRESVAFLRAAVKALRLRQERG